MSSIAALIMARSMATQYYGGNMFAAMDGQLASCRTASNGNFEARALKNVANGHKYNYMIAEADLDAQVANQEYNVEKKLQDEFAKSFDVFG